MLVNYEALQCPGSPCQSSSSAAGPSDRAPVRIFAETLHKAQEMPIPKLEKAPTVWPFPDSSKDGLRQLTTVR